MVMEYVQGKNLEQYLHANGIFSEFHDTQQPIKSAGCFGLFTHKTRKNITKL